MKKSFQAVPHILALSLLAAFALPAAAQSAGSNVVNVGWFSIHPRDSSETLVRTSAPLAGPVQGSGAGVGGADTLGLAFTHFWTDNFATTLDAGLPPRFHLQGQGTLSPLGEIGSAKQWSPALVAKWFFGAPDAQFRPFIGAGVSYIWYSDIQLSQGFQNAAALGAGSASADLSSSWAPVVSAGMTVNLDKNWSLNVSASYLRFKTDATVTGSNPALGPYATQTSRTSLTINPFVTFLSVGYKF